MLRGQPAKARRATDNERRAGRNEEFAAVKHNNNNNTNIHEQTTYATEYQLERIWDAYALVTGLNQQTNEFQVATFVTCIGQEALKVYNGSPFQAEEEMKDMAKILEQ